MKNKFYTLSDAWNTLVKTIDMETKDDKIEIKIVYFDAIKKLAEDKLNKLSNTMSEIKEVSNIISKMTPEEQYKEEQEILNKVKKQYKEEQEILNKTNNKALRYNDGKPQWSLVDFDSLIPMVRVLEYGAKKYTTALASGRNNWKKGLNKDQILESLMRHLVELMKGEEIDKESKLPHIGHILCNAQFYSYFNTPKEDAE